VGGHNIIATQRPSIGSPLIIAASRRHGSSRRFLRRYRRERPPNVGVGLKRGLPVASQAPSAFSSVRWPSALALCRVSARAAHASPLWAVLVGCPRASPSAPSSQAAVLTLAALHTWSPLQVRCGPLRCDPRVLMQRTCGPRTASFDSKLGVSVWVADRRHRSVLTGSPTLQTLQDAILLLPWLCFRRWRQTLTTAGLHRVPRRDLARPGTV
jgi:hypothetical protein